jgi:hypothetical protein
MKFLLILNVLYVKNKKVSAEVYVFNVKTMDNNFIDIVVNVDYLKI